MKHGQHSGGRDTGSVPVQSLSLSVASLEETLLRGFVPFLFGRKAGLCLFGRKAVFFVFGRKATPQVEDGDSLHDDDNDEESNTQGEPCHSTFRVGGGQHVLDRVFTVGGCKHVLNRVLGFIRLRTGHIVEILGELEDAVVKFLPLVLEGHIDELAPSARQPRHLGHAGALRKFESRVFAVLRHATLSCNCCCHSAGVDVSFHRDIEVSFQFLTFHV